MNITHAPDFRSNAAFEPASSRGLLEQGCANDGADVISGRGRLIGRPQFDELLRTSVQPCLGLVEASTLAQALDELTDQSTNTVDHERFLAWLHGSGGLSGETTVAVSAAAATAVCCAGGPPRARPKPMHTHPTFMNPPTPSSSSASALRGASSRQSKPPHFRQGRFVVSRGQVQFQSQGAEQEYQRRNGGKSQPIRAHVVPACMATSLAMAAAAAAATVIAKTNHPGHRSGRRRVVGSMPRGTIYPPRNSVTWPSTPELLKFGQPLARTSGNKGDAPLKETSTRLSAPTAAIRAAALALKAVLATAEAARRLEGLSVDSGPDIPSLDKACLERRGDPLLWRLSSRSRTESSAAHVLNDSGEGISHNDFSASADCEPTAKVDLAAPIESQTVGTPAGPSSGLILNQRGYVLGANVSPVIMDNCRQEDSIQVTQSPNERPNSPEVDGFAEEIANWPLDCALASSNGDTTEPFRTIAVLSDPRPVSTPSVSDVGQSEVSASGPPSLVGILPLRPLDSREVPLDWVAAPLESLVTIQDDSSHSENEFSIRLASAAPSAICAEMTDVCDESNHTDEMEVHEECKILVQDVSVASGWKDADHFISTKNSWADVSDTADGTDVHEAEGLLDPDRCIRNAFSNSDDASFMSCAAWSDSASGAAVDAMEDLTSPNYIKQRRNSKARLNPESDDVIAEESDAEINFATQWPNFPANPKGGGLEWDLALKVSDSCSLPGEPSMDEIEDLPLDPSTENCFSPTRVEINGPRGATYLQYSVSSSISCQEVVDAGIAEDQHHFEFENQFLSELLAESNEMARMEMEEKQQLLSSEETKVEIATEECLWSEEHAHQSKRVGHSCFVEEEVCKTEYDSNDTSQFRVEGQLGHSEAPTRADGPLRDACEQEALSDAQVQARLQAADPPSKEQTSTATVGKLSKGLALVQEPVRMQVEEEFPRRAESVWTDEGSLKNDCSRLRAHDEARQSDELRRMQVEELRQLEAETLFEVELAVQARERTRMNAEEVLQRDIAKLAFKNSQLAACGSIIQQTDHSGVQSEIDDQRQIQGYPSQDWLESEARTAASTHGIAKPQVLDEVNSGLVTAVLAGSVSQCKDLLLLGGSVNQTIRPPLVLRGLQTYCANYRYFCDNGLDFGCVQDATAAAVYVPAAAIRTDQRGRWFFEVEVMKPGMTRDTTEVAGVVWSCLPQPSRHNIPPEPIRRGMLKEVIGPQAPIGIFIDGTGHLEMWVFDPTGAHPLVLDTSFSGTLRSGLVLGMAIEFDPVRMPSAAVVAFAFDGQWSDCVKVSMSSALVCPGAVVSQGARLRFHPSENPLAAAPPWEDAEPALEYAHKVSLLIAAMLSHRWEIATQLAETGFKEFTPKQVASLIQTADTTTGRTALHLAAAAGQSHLAKELLGLRADASLRDYDGMLPLELAAQGCHAESAVIAGQGVPLKACKPYIQVLLGFLLGSGHCSSGSGVAAAFAAGRKQSTKGAALRTAALRGLDAAVRLLLQNGAEVNQPSAEGATALGIACREGHLDVAETLLVGKAAVDVALLPGRRCAFKAAAQIGNCRAVNLLLRYGASPLGIGSGQVSSNPFAAACRCGHVAVVETLLDSMPSLSKHVVVAGGLTSLHVACQADSEVVVSLLLRSQADVNVVTENGRTPLHCAAQHAAHKVTAVLLHSGAFVNVEDSRGVFALHLAARLGHATVVSAWFRHCAGSATLREPDGATVLHAACHGGSREVVSWLLNGRVSVNDPMANSVSALHSAAQAGHADVAALLLAAEADLHSRALGGFTPLAVAVKSGHESFSRFLLLFGAEVDDATQSQWTPLAFASYCGHASIAEELLEAGASLTARTCHGRTPLIIATQAGHSEVVAVLLRFCADGSVAMPGGWTALHLASQAGFRDIVVELANRDGGSFTDYLDDGWAALHVAARAGHEAVIAELVLHCDPSMRIRCNKKSLGEATGATALHIAARVGHRGVALQLLDASAMVDASIEGGATALHAASQEGHADIVQALLAYGAKQDPTCNSGSTPTMLAAQRGHAAVVAELLAANANPTSSAQCWTPLLLASKRGHVGVVETLLQHAADVQVRTRNGRTAEQIADTAGHFCVALVLNNWRGCQPENKVISTSSRLQTATRACEDEASAICGLLNDSINASTMIPSSRPLTPYSTSTCARSRPQTPLTNTATGVHYR